VGRLEMIETRTDTLGKLLIAPGNDEAATA